MRSRSGSDASVLSIHFAWAGVSGERGSNGAGAMYVGGAGSGVGFGRGGMDATTPEVPEGAGCGAGFPAHETAPEAGARKATAARARMRVVFLVMGLSYCRARLESGLAPVIVSGSRGRVIPGGAGGACGAQ